MLYVCALLSEMHDMHALFHSVFSFQLIGVTIACRNIGKDNPISTLNKSERFYLHYNHAIHCKNCITINGLLNGK